MTTDGQIVELVRDIDVLLEMNSYQDMSDAEIQSVIDYYVEDAKRTARNELLVETQFKEERELAATRREHAQAAADVLKSRLEIEIPWVTVGSDS